MTINELQAEMDTWCRANFPDTNYTEQFLGVVEELGEASHALLKKQQGIRESVTGQSDELLTDAFADMFVYMLNFCNYYGIDFDKAIHETWNQVKSRDWRKYPKNGRTE